MNQPTTVRFTYGTSQDTDISEDNIGESIYYFLWVFLEKHPEVADRNFDTRESHGGHSVPSDDMYFCALIHDHTAELQLSQSQGLADQQEPGVWLETWHSIRTVQMR